MNSMKNVSYVIVRKAIPDDADVWALILHESVNHTYQNYISRDYLDNNYNVEKLKQIFLNEINRGGQNFIYWQLMMFL